MERCGQPEWLPTQRNRGWPGTMVTHFVCRAHVRALTSAGLWCGLVFQSEFLVTPGASATFTCSGKEVTGSAADEATGDGTGAADGAGGGAGATSVATASDSGARLLVYVVFPIDESVKV